jgi:hypothetical protein
MDDEKKSGASWEKRARLGPYELEEQMPQEPHSPGEMYRARHEKSGATALVLKPDAEEDVAGLRDCRVRFISSVAPSYIALEVEDSPGAVGSRRNSVEGLVLLFEGVQEGVRRMARAFDGDPEPRRWWRWGLASAGVAAVGVLLLALVRLAFVSQPPSGPEPLANTPPAPMSHEVPTAGGNAYPFFNSALTDTTDVGEPVLARQLPREPFKGQKRPPCARYSEVELVGGCWMQHVLKAPCPEELFEYQGNCYVPAFSAKPPPQSLGQ